MPVKVAALPASRKPQIAPSQSEQPFGIDPVVQAVKHVVARNEVSACQTRGDSDAGFVQGRARFPHVAKHNHGGEGQGDILGQKTRSNVVADAT